MRKSAFLAFGAAALLAPAANAATIYISDDFSRLLTFDTVTKNTAFVGFTTLNNRGVDLFDIAENGAGALYGVDGVSNLYKVSTANGSLTSVGSGTNHFVNALVFGSNGTLYGAGNNSFYTLNTATGVATTVGSTGYASSGDLAFLNNILYLSTDSGLATVNVATGAATLLGGASGLFGLASAGGVLYGVKGNDIYTLNTSNGQATLYAQNALGLATGYGAASLPGAVPEPASWAMFIGGFGLAGAALRRRPRTTVQFV